MSSFIDQFKNRNMWRTVVAYPTAAFIILQAVDFFIVRYNWDYKFLTFTLILLAGGFPMTLIHNWFHGEAGKQKYALWEKITHGFLIIAALSLSTSYWITGPWSEDANEEYAGFRENSIAVLPLDNRSESKENAFFADGMHNELLTRLSKISALRVTSRTSMLGYRDTNMSIPEIAKELGVAYIVEGGVQRSDDRIRINVQLIDAASDEHIWAETYDRDLTTKNIFDIQSELVLAIATRIRTQFSDAEEAAIQKLPTTNLELYDDYIKSKLLL